jgi:septal ring factor EnvC (AmiA/AmiB activator)
MSSLYGPPLEGSFRWPRGFGVQRTATHRHQGLDFDVPEGRKWLAIADGTIEHALNEPGPRFSGYGRVVVLRFVDADGTTKRALYAHGKDVAVTAGQQVRKGTVLGLVGRSQFRSRRALERARIPVPPGYTPSQDDGAGSPPRANGSRMSPHLHFEISTAAYPQGSEAPTRVDPLAWFLERGVARARASSGDGRIARADTGRTPHQARTPLEHARAVVASAELQADLTRRVFATDREIERAALLLGSAGLTNVASSVQLAWQGARAVLLERIRSAPAELEAIRTAVAAWTTRVAELRDTLAAQVASSSEAIASQIRAFGDRLIAIWDAIAWTGRVAAGVAIGGAGVLLLLMFGVMAFGQYTGARYVYRRARRRLAS